MIGREYQSSSQEFVRTHVERYEESAGSAAGVDYLGHPCVILHTIGNRSGKLRKVPVMRVEHEGRYAAVASFAGRPDNPSWLHNLRADPYAAIQDGDKVREMSAFEVVGGEREAWWSRAVATFPEFEKLQCLTDRLFPIVVLEPVAP
jgi:F420H(2)-dependent quinone reductase